MKNLLTNQNKSLFLDSIRKLENSPIVQEKLEVVEKCKTNFGKRINSHIEISQQRSADDSVVYLKPFKPEHPLLDVLNKHFHDALLLVVQ